MAQPVPVSPVPASGYVQTMIFVALTAVALFGSAGTFALAGFWIYFAVIVAFSVASLYMLDPELISERMRPGGQRPPLALQLVAIVPFGHWLLAGLDRRFHWSDSVPPWLQALALIAFAAGMLLFLWAMYVNRFFSSLARIQSDRGQHLVTDGPYGFVRHPGYAAAVVLIIASGLALDSWVATFVLIVVGLPLLLWRLTNEERMLYAELPGYTAYADLVRWRLLPGVW